MRRAFGLQCSSGTSGQRTGRKEEGMVCAPDCRASLRSLSQGNMQSLNKISHQRKFALDKNILALVPLSCLFIGQEQPGHQCGLNMNVWADLKVQQLISQQVFFKKILKIFFTNLSGLHSSCLTRWRRAAQQLGALLRIGVLQQNIFRCSINFCFIGYFYHRVLPFSRQYLSHF